MFREMRNSHRQLSDAETLEILRRGTHGVLALSGDDGYPYAVPISYVCTGEKIYFHGAKTGHKIDAIARCAKASFCVVDQDCVIPERCTTTFRSAIVFGTLRILENPAEARDALIQLAGRYAPGGDPAPFMQKINSGMPNVCMLEMHIEHMTGKVK